jgi:hypothetical protein
MDPSLDCTHGNLEALSNLGVSQMLVMKKQKSATILGPQLAQRQSHLFREMGMRRIGSFLFFGHIDQRLRSGPTAASGEGRPATIPRDGQQPWLEFTTAIPMMEMATDANERLLGSILGILTLPQPTETESHHAFAITRYQFA